jgi:O-succinylbenzoic acid--CoA ligase
VAAYVALAPDADAADGSTVAALRGDWHGDLGFAAPKTVLTAAALKMLPNGKPDRMAMTAELSALHQGK